MKVTGFYRERAAKSVFEKNGKGNGRRGALTRDKREKKSKMPLSSSLSDEI